MAVDHQRQPAGRTPDRADPNHDVRDRSVDSAADVEQVAGAQGLQTLPISLGQLDGANRDQLVGGLQRVGPVGLQVNGRANADPKTLIEDKAGQVATVDPFAVVPHASLLPRPVGRRIPVGNMVILITVSQEACRRGHNPFALPLDVGLRKTGQRRIAARARPPAPESAPDLPRIPFRMRHVRLAQWVAALGVLQVADQIRHRAAELQPVGRIDIAPSRRRAAGLPAAGQQRRRAPAQSVLRAARREHRFSLSATGSPAVIVDSGCIASPRLFGRRWAAKVYLTVLWLSGGVIRRVF